MKVKYLWNTNGGRCLRHTAFAGCDLRVEIESEPVGFAAKRNEIDDLQGCSRSPRRSDAKVVATANLPGERRSATFWMFL